MHNLNTTNVQSDSVLGTNMQVVDAALDSVAYEVWVNASGLEDAGDAASPTYGVGDLTTGLPAQWRLANGVTSSVCAYVKCNSQWKNGLVGVTPHYSSTVSGGNIVWKVTIVPIKNLTVPTSTSVSLTKSAPVTASVITTVDLKDNTLSNYASIDPSHIGVLVCVGRVGGDVADTNTGVVYIYGLNIVYRELTRVVGGK